MEFILLSILLIISFGCYSEGKVERKGVKLVLSISLAFMLVMFMEAALYSLVLSEKLQGTLMIIAYFIFPIISFFSFQLLLYNIKLLEHES